MAPPPMDLSCLKRATVTRASFDAFHSLEALNYALLVLQRVQVILGYQSASFPSAISMSLHDLCVQSANDVLLLFQQSSARLDSWWDGDCQAANLGLHVSYQKQRTTANLT
mmetsp:Transcript_15424/g.25497  ORF Transcript_15424/g.25497 Transcript_15424/m.25497 type:complete len:111 (-) Transcript_15424:974-1306(-)